MDYEEDNYIEEDVSDEEIEMVLEEYHRKRLLENMSGPTISLIAHINMGSFSMSFGCKIFHRFWGFELSNF